MRTITTAVLDIYFLVGRFFFPHNCNCNCLRRIHNSFRPFVVDVRNGMSGSARGGAEHLARIHGTEEDKVNYIG